MGCVKGVAGLCLSVGLFLAILAFEGISLMGLVCLCWGVGVGVALAVSYVSGQLLPLFVQMTLALGLLSLLSKYHLLLYYKLIHPGDHLRRRCWTLLSKVLKLTYISLGSYAIFEVIRLYKDSSQRSRQGQQGERRDGTLVGVLWGMWEGDCKMVLGWLSLLVHGFSICLCENYTLLCRVLPLCGLRSLLALLLSVVVQGIHFGICVCEFWIVHSWVDPSMPKDHLPLYVILTQLSLFVWVIKVTVMELMIEKVCHLLDRSDEPYFWFQNMTRGRVVLLKFVLTPLCVYLFWADLDISNLRLDFLMPSVTPDPLLLFLSVFFATLVHALKTLMLLKNGLARLVYGCWLCYFGLYDFFFCCDDLDDDLTDLSSLSSTPSHLSLTRKSHLSQDPNERDDGRRRTKRPPSLNRNHFGDHPGKGGVNSDGDLQLPKEVVVLRTGGVGDNQWTPQEFPPKHSNIPPHDLPSPSFAPQSAPVEGNLTSSSVQENEVELRVKSFTGLL